MPRCTHPDCPTHTEPRGVSLVRIQMERGRAAVALKYAQRAALKATKEAERLTKEIARLDAQIEKRRGSGRRA